MTIKTVHSSAQDVAVAVSELAEQLGSLKAKFLLFFVSPKHDPAKVGQALGERFDCPSLGGTTAGELASGRFMEGAIVMMAFDADHVESVAVELVNDTSSDDSVREAYAKLARGVDLDDAPDVERHLGFVLHDGMGGREEAVMSALSSLSNVPFIGGSAGDGGRFEATHVFVNGQASTKSAGLALLKLKHKYRILKTQSFDILDEVLTVTRADEASRRVLEFNGKPAAEEYARAIGVSVEQLPDHFGRHPLGLIVGDDEPFVRSPQQIQGSDVVFYCNIQQGMDLKVLKSRDIVSDTKRDLEQALSEFGKVEGLVNFHCILRTLELVQNEQTEAYARIFAAMNSIGFSTYGESYIGHINQTSVMVLFA